ncbi:MAG TPA: hypothetical protein VGL17_09160 [Gemmatimonadaceae bacterium]|jgi:hypothetical protein
MLRKIAWVVSLALLLFTGIVGLYNGTTEWKPDLTPFQKSVTGGVFLYGVIGLVAAFGLFRRRRWSVATSLVWAAIVAYVPGAAVMAYGGNDATLGAAIGASGASAVIGAGVVWTAWAATRADRPLQQDEQPASERSKS